MLFKLVCPAQNYAWGKPGLQSSVAQLAREVDIPIDESKPYAEYWVGTHPNGPAKVVDGGNTLLLKDWLASNPAYLSSVDGESTSGDLPYLFKVLSVAKALSIQAHPDIPLAKKLHADRPNIYKDPNHKPEMACAITEFEALCGFEAVDTVLAEVDRVPELKSVLSSNADAWGAIEAMKAAEKRDEAAEKALLKAVFTALMTSDKDAVKTQVGALIARLGDAGELAGKDKLVLRLGGEYPGDVGVFCAYFLCYRTLQPGQAVFLGANEPHAYLRGDCAEIMACSDNVVRAGLTPKLIDVPTLCSMLTYRQPAHEGSEFHPGNILAGFPRNDNTVVYAPPDSAVTEFEMERTNLPGSEEYTLPVSTFASVILVLEGSGIAQNEGSTPTVLKRGGVFIQPAGTKVVIGSGENGLLFFRSTKKGAVQA